MSANDIAARNATLAHQVIDRVLAAGCVNFVISPGSRNTPLVMAVAHSGAPAEVVLDERSAAFFALGQARASCAPVALICTSGSAGGNYFPAIIEAWESGVPIVVITADRPHDEQCIGAPQTTRQGLFYEDHIKGRWLVGAADETNAAEALPELERLLRLCTAGKPGPVHLNMGFREPLYENVPRLVEKPAAPTTNPSCGQELPELPSAGRGLVVVGPVLEASPDAALAVQAVADLAASRGWPVLADIGASLRHRADHAAALVNKFDLFLRSAGAREALAPDFVLHIGRMPTSKSLYLWLRDLEQGGTPTWNLSSNGEPHSLARNANGVVCAWGELLDACEREQRRSVTADSAWLAAWRRAETTAEQVVADESRNAGLWEGRVAASAAQLPAESRLVLASGMAIRDMETYALQLPVGGACIVNRGVNGIDGLIATAAGVAAADPSRRVRLVMGDQAFQHDVGSLALAARQGNLDIVVINNGGGGIFEFLPIRKAQDQFERFFLAPQCDRLAEMAAGFGVAARRCENADELESLLAEPDPGCRVIEVIVAREHNVAVHKRIGSQVTASIDKLFPLESIDGKRRDAAQGGVEPG